MPEKNPISNPNETPFDNRKTAGYGFYGRHDSSQIEIGNKDNSSPTIYPGSGMAQAKSSIKRIIKTPGGM